jgi:carboxyl-terminal processing protease
MPFAFPRTLRAAACALPILLSACGGGGDGGSCTVASEQDWLGSYMNSWYFWYALSPHPSPAAYATVDAYFTALKYQGGDPIPNGGGATWPSDRYSYSQTTESFNRFFGDGRTLGYGVAVAGLEVTLPAPQPAAPLYVRYVEPASPAAAGGIQRGDRVMSLNGVPATTLIQNNDFTALNANAVGDVLTLVLRNAGGVDRTVVLTANTFALTPVQNGQVFSTPNGRKVGYVFVKDMISQVNTPLSSAMNTFKANGGVQDVVIDLRYNGGGLVSTGATVASYISGSGNVGRTFASLLYNDKQQANNATFTFADPGAWAGFNRVYVLIGERTCSASELVINGLRGIGVNVVGIGGTTCGKPVGFLPKSDSCGTTYSVVNFEAVNAANQGRYFNGLAPTCAVAEDFTRPVADVNDPLLVGAAYHADHGACPPGTSARELPQSRSTSPRQAYNGADGGERTGMSAR